MNYWDDIGRHTDYASTWMAHPLVRAAINERVSGDPNVWPVTALGRLLGTRIPVGPALSIGCGLGTLERSLLKEQIVSTITGVDVSEPALAAARGAAAEEGLSVEYLCTDAREFLRAHPDSFAAIFFHQSLHHFDGLDELMALAGRSLRRDGFLYVDEYVGPSRDEWSAWKLIIPNLTYRLLPRRTHRPHIVRAPINREDPTEAVASSGIVGAIEKHFGVTHRRDYGGNILAIVYPNLREPDDRSIARLLALEERLLRSGARSFYTVMLGERR